MFKDFLSQLLSANESRKSCVVIILLFISGFSILKLHTTGDIPSNAMTIIITLSTLIFGMNALPSLSEIITSTKMNSIQKVTEIPQDLNNSSENGSI